MSSEISPKAEVSPKAKIGDGCKIFPFVYIEDDVVIGDNCIPKVHGMSSLSCNKSWRQVNSDKRLTAPLHHEELKIRFLFRLLLCKHSSHSFFNLRPFAF